MATLTKCDRCGKTGEMVPQSPELHPHHGHLPVGWSSVLVNIESMQKVHSPQGVIDAEFEVAPPRSGKVVDLHDRGELVELPIVVQSKLDLCPDCTNMFVLAAGEGLIKRQADPLPPPPPFPPWYPGRHVHRR